MNLFSDTELLIMIIVVSLLIIFITILTIIDVKDRIRSRNEMDLEFDNYDEDLVNVYNNDTKVEDVLVENSESNNFDDELFTVEDEIFEPVKIVDNKVSDHLVVELEDDIINENDVISEVNTDNIIYSSIVKTKEDAIRELNELTITLEKEELEDNKNDFISKLDEFEQDEEENAIISLAELDKISESLYEKNEIKQYDDGNEPISIEEVLSLINGDNGTNNVVNDNVSNVYEKENLTPFVSIYGIENGNDMEFENTANFDKLDRNNRNFLDKLKEVHKELGN